MKHDYSRAQWTPHQDPYEKARGTFSVAHMSNAKWRKTFRAIAEANLNLPRSEWKYIDSDHVIYQRGMPHIHDLDIPQGWLADGPFGPVEYKWIEWIRFPRRYQPYAGVSYMVEQDLAGLSRVLATVGQLRLEHNDEHLILLAYERRSPRQA